MPKVLIADKMSPSAMEVFKNRGVDVDVITGLSKEELIKIIGIRRSCCALINAALSLIHI